MERDQAGRDPGPAGPLAVPELVRLLYIDDDPALSRLVQRHLARAGCEVRLASDGDAGVALAAGGGCDAIALDNYMPGRDGIDLLPELLALPDAPPVIFVTAAEEPRLAVAALKLGAADYVVKDTHGGFLDLLEGAIRQSIARERLGREHAAAARALRDSHERLEQLAAQQSILLREVNHRVANSLQLITSLMELQARRLADPAARAALRRAAERVDAVTLVHRRLYASGEVGVVEMKSYLTGLVEELRKTVHQEEGGATIELDAEPVRVETDKAVPIGLIVNEWVTNALKYAYPEGTPGGIRVSLRRSGEHALRLVVEDDGVGLPEGPAAEPRGSGLGSLIVGSMAQTLRAMVEQDRSHRGTRFVLSLAG